MEVSIVTNFIIDRFRANTMVNTISVKPQSEIDFEKSNIYPLVNIDLTALQPLESVHQMTFNITVFQQRDIKPTINLDNKLLNTNLIDNLNETYSIASKFINYMRSFNNDEDIEVISISEVTPLKNVLTNGLDGVTFNIVLEIPDLTGCE